MSKSNKRITSPRFQVGDRVLVSRSSTTLLIVRNVMVGETLGTGEPCYVVEHPYNDIPRFTVWDESQIVPCPPDQEAIIAQKRALRALMLKVVRDEELEDFSDLTEAIYSHPETIRELAKTIAETRNRAFRAVQRLDYWLRTICPGDAADFPAPYRETRVSGVAYDDDIDGC